MFGWKCWGLISFWRTYRSKNFILNIYYNYFIIINLQFNIFYNINFPIINFWFFIISFYKSPLLFKTTTVLISSPFNLIITKKFATKKYFLCLGRIIIQIPKRYYLIKNINFLSLIWTNSSLHFFWSKFKRKNTREAVILYFFWEGR